MKGYRTVCLAMAVALLCAAWCAWSQAAVSDNDTMAVVNGEVITRGALMDELLNMTNAGRTTLNEMIGETLLMQEAKKRNIKVTDQEIQDRIYLIKQRLGTQNQAERFEQYLKQRNVTPAGLTPSVRMELVAEKLLADQVQVTDQEVEDVYVPNKSLYDQPEKVVLRWIVVKTEADAKAVMARLDKKEAFADVARQVSIDLPSRQAGGMLGEAVKAQLAEELQGPAFSTEVGRYTQPIKMSPGEYVILMVEQKTAAVRHNPLLVKTQIRAELRQRKLRQALSVLMQRLIDSGKIENRLAPKPAEAAPPKSPAPAAAAPASAPK